MKCFITDFNKFQHYCAEKILDLWGNKQVTLCKLRGLVTIIFFLLGLSIACTGVRDLDRSLLSSYMSNIAQTLHQPLFENF